MKAPLAFNNANLAQSPALLWAPEQHGEFSQEAGFNAYEWHALNHLLVSPKQVAQAAKMGSLLLSSYHQSFLERGPSSGTNNTPPTLLSKLVFPALMPEMLSSVDYLKTVDALAQPAIETILVAYPNANAELDATFQEGANWQVAHQATNNTYDAIGATSLEDYLEKIKARNSKVVIDTFHIRRTYGMDNNNPISGWQRSIPALNEEIISAHISAGRADILGEDHIPTDAELRALISGKIGGEFADIMQAIKNAPNLKQVTLEVTASSIKRVARVRRLKDVQKTYAQIAGNITSFFE